MCTTRISGEVFPPLKTFMICAYAHTTQRDAPNSICPGKRPNCNMTVVKN